MVKVIALVLASLLLIGCATTSFVPAGINEIPMYDGANFTEQQKAANDRFISDVTSSGSTREEAAAQAVARGWQYLNQYDYSTSMKRFNQAWLLNPQNPDIFWGYGDWYGYQKKYDKAVDMFKLGLDLKRDHAGIMYDLAYTYNLKGIEQQNGKTPERAKWYFDDSIKLLEKVVVLKPKWADPHVAWSAALMQQGRFSEALEKARMARELGGRLEPGYYEFLESSAKKSGK